MKKINPLGVFLILLLLVVAIGPLIIPLPPLEGILPIEELVYPDSQFLDVNGVSIHFQEIQNDGQTLIVLLHGFGSSSYSWHKVMEPLSSYGAVLAYDRPAFGLTERVIPYKEVENNPYLICVLTEKVATNKAGREIIGTISRIVYDEFSKEN